MVYQSRIFHLFKPKTTFFQLGKAEVIYGLKMRLFLMILFSAVIFALEGLMGIGSTSISRTLTIDPKGVFEWHKALFVMGKILSGIIYSIGILYIAPLAFSVFADVSYRKLVVIQVFVLFILLIEHITYFPLVLWLDLDWYSSPLSFGVIGQYITTTPFLIALLGSLSIFKIWGIYIQYKGLCSLSEKKRVPLLILVIVVNLIFWGIISLLTDIDFYRLF
ncbi:hypothetical protein [Heyndrickxia vini]|uniref:Yip1 domain-containing protein n=1 Tax=Heyndrickxia vini TaxID=1476025 RepID=A0ABX7E1Q3_9BACI|nr:hypothetical protein [Heyndrickxia vini]QQZ09185.1 hypothetical protein I5776_19815 [Heyndrickxia vini]